MKKIIAVSILVLLSICGHKAYASGENYKFDHYDVVSSWVDNQCTPTGIGLTCSGQCVKKEQRRQVCVNDVIASCVPGQIDTVTTGTFNCSIVYLDASHCQCKSSS